MAAGREFGVGLSGRRNVRDQPMGSGVGRRRGGAAARNTARADSGHVVIGIRTTS